ncbi:transposase [Rhodanobacter ginsengisoli]|uniref:Transposase n=1 Tax=Rhodanobacter ginsengisoli TaxID=418646 RepID=A0ABW0QNR7_9GAMM
MDWSNWAMAPTCRQPCNASRGGTARRVKQQCPFEGRLWEKGFHDHALRRDESVEKAARYIIANPVRAGLVRDPMDYPYWDAWFVDRDNVYG